MEDTFTMDAHSATDLDESVVLAPVPGKPQPAENHMMRYSNVTDPETGNSQRWTNASNFATALTDAFGLSLWHQMMVLKGAALEPSLLAETEGREVKTDWNHFKALIERAKKAAGANKASDLGKAIHAATEALDTGTAMDQIREYRKEVQAYAEALALHGLSAYPHLVERIVCVPDLGVVGTFDRILKTSDGQYLLADIKTGSLDKEESRMQIQILLALYAHGVNAHGIWDREKETWVDAPKVREDIGLVIHLPAGTGTCQIKTVDLEAGWRKVGHCVEVKKDRKVKPFPDYVPTATYKDWFRSAQSRAELAKLYEAAENDVSFEELAELAELGKQRMAQLSA
jgi:hypothetical protein